MNEFELKDGKTFQSIIESISHLIKYVFFSFKNDTFDINAVAEFNIASLVLKIKKGFFDTYNCTKEQKISVDLHSFNNLLKRSKAKDKIKFSFLDDKNKIRLEFEDTENKTKRSFDLSTLEDESVINDKEINRSKIQTTVKLTMKPDLIQTPIKDAKIIDGESLELEVTNEMLKISTIRDIINDLYTFEIKFGDDTKDDITEVKVDEKVDLFFALSYMEKIFKIGNLAKEVTIELGDDQPAIFTFDIENVDLFYVLANQIPEDEDDFDDDEFDAEFDDADEFEDI